MPARPAARPQGDEQPADGPAPLEQPAPPEHPGYVGHVYDDEDHTLQGQIAKLQG